MRVSEDGKIEIYDLTTDEMRELRPADVEYYERQTEALQYMFTELRKITEIGKIAEVALRILHRKGGGRSE